MNEVQHAGFDERKEFTTQATSNQALERAANEYGDREYHNAIHFWDEGINKHKPEVLKSDFVNSFIAGAEWQKRQDMQKFLYSQTAMFTREEFDAEIENAKAEQKQQDDELLIIAHFDGVQSGKEAERKEMMKQAVVWKKAKEGFKCGEDDFVFTLDKDGKMSPYWDTEVEEGQYYLTKQDLENLPKEQ